MGGMQRQYHLKNMPLSVLHMFADSVFMLLRRLLMLLLSIKR